MLGTLLTVNFSNMSKNLIQLANLTIRQFDHEFADDKVLNLQTFSRHLKV